MNREEVARQGDVERSSKALAYILIIAILNKLYRTCNPNTTEGGIHAHPLEINVFELTTYL